jgi:hypothetical protein
MSRESFIGMEDRKERSAPRRRLGPDEQAVREFQCYIDDPVATIDRALADSPAFVMGHVLRAYLHLLGTEPAGLPVALRRHPFESIPFPCCSGPPIGRRAPISRSACRPARIRSADARRPARPALSFGTMPDHLPM